MSVGNVTQALNLHDTKLTLVLGENLDLGGGGSRNGVGKSTIVQAISFALFGSPLTNIKLDNLINKTNNKEMVVSIKFAKNGNHYHIERGRRPGLMKFMVNERSVDGGEQDEAHGDIRVTQKEIDRILGLSREMFKHIVALNTTTEPFLSQGSGSQRVLIEELLGIMQLSQKGDLLRDKTKITKDRIAEEEIRIKTVTESNEKIQGNIDQLHLKSRAWEKTHTTNLLKYQNAVDNLKGVDTAAEIESHRTIALYTELENALKQFKVGKKSEETVISRAEKQMNSLAKQVTTTENKTCPMCESDLHDHKHEEIMLDLVAQCAEIQQTLDQATGNLGSIQQEIDSIEGGINELGGKPNTYYGSLEETYNHKSSLESLTHSLETENEQQNPFTDQIDQLTTDGITEVTWDEVNRLTRVREHQDFLLKLLADKNSFIRKKIIDQNLAYLNHRLEHYLEKLGLPHEVRFQSDLSVEISELGRDFDFDNLSRGEKNRLILGLSFAFRDVWESLNDSINLLFVDELIDSGMDQIGVESALSVLKGMGRERNKDVFLISHKEELLSRVSNVLLVRKEAGFTQFTDDTEQTDDI